MSETHPVPDFLKRSRNFFYTRNEDLEALSASELNYYSIFQKQLDEIRALIKEMKSEHAKIDTLLKTVFGNVYSLLTYSNGIPQFDPNATNSSIASDSYQACYFMSLCMFLFETRRLKGKSLRRFIYDNSPQKYHIKGTTNYFDFKNIKREASGQMNLSDETKLRQYQNRLFSLRPVHHPNSEWSAMRKVSEHEWTLYYIMDNADKDIQRTFWLIRTLNGNLEKALKSAKDPDKLKDAYNKYLSKLSKVKYDKLLRVYEYIINHINEDKSYYGINLYRFEKELRFYQMTDNIKRFLKCKTQKEQNQVLLGTMALDNVCFPKVSRHLWTLPTLNERFSCAANFTNIMEDSINMSLLFYDQFIEDGLFGDDWESTFCETMNRLTTSVLYDPKSVDHLSAPNVQDAFLKITSVSAFVNTWSKYSQLVPKYASEYLKRIKQPLKYLLVPLK